MTISPDGDDMTGVFQVDVLNPGGTLIVSDTGTVKGRASKWKRCPSSDRLRQGAFSTGRLSRMKGAKRQPDQGKRG